MKKNYLRERHVNKIIITLTLFMSLLPNLSLSQNPSIVSQSSFEVPQLSNSPGFEYNPTSTEWTFYGQSGLSRNWTVFTGANPVAPLGNQVLFLQDNGNINGYAEKTVNFTQSGYYRVRFKAAWRQICCGKTKYIRILVDGVEAGEIQIKSQFYEEYMTLPVKLTSGNHTIRIEGDNPQNGGDYTGFVDDFRIEKLPVLPNYLNFTTVSAGITYVIGPSFYNFQALSIKGTLVAPQNQDVNITANYILVENSGRFQIGQERSPYQHQATITLNGTNLNQHPHMDTKFLGAMNNGVIELHGKEKVSWTKLRASVSPLSTPPNRLKLAEAVDWEVGDEIIIAPSKAPGRNPDDTENDSFANEYEKRKINFLTNSNQDLILDAAVNHLHNGAATTPYSGNGQNWTVDTRAEVGLLTRNIKIQGSDSGDKFGAHVMIMRSNDDKINNRKAQAYFNGVELYRMGQSGKEGRYPFHWHVMDDVDGQYFKNSSVHQSYNRALTIHATNKALVENSVFFDHIGHGIFFETGYEEENQILGNLVIGSKKPVGSEILTTGETIDEWQNRGPASYWITHPNNTIEGNVAAGTVGTGFWYIFPFKDLEYGVKKPLEAPFGSFKNNVAHSTNSGFDIYDALRPDHSVDKNVTYFSPGPFEILNSTWYANRIGVYTGTGANRTTKDEYSREIYFPDDLLTFKNNIFADNEKSIMLASNNQIKNSLFVANTGNSIAPISGQTMIFMYDGAGTISDSHIVGYNSNASSMMSLAGATFTYGNFRFNNVTKANNNVIFNISGTDASSQKLKRNATIYDQTGSLSGISGSTLVLNNPFFLLGDSEEDDDIVGWTNVIRSSRRYVNTRLRIHPFLQSNNTSWMPSVDVIRTESGSNAKIINDFRGGGPTSNNPAITPTLPFITNDQDLLYTYDWVYGPRQDIEDIMYTGPDIKFPANSDEYVSPRILQFKLANAVAAGDFVIVRFKDMNLLPGLDVNMNYELAVNTRLPAIDRKKGYPIDEKWNLTSLKVSPTSAYFIEGNDLYIKAVSNGQFSQYFNIKWDEVTLPGGVPNNIETLGGEQSLTDKTEMIYPNPASTKLYIRGIAEGEEVQIVDLGGRILQTTTYKEYLDISKLNSGVYVIRTKNGSHRFIKE